MKLEDQVVSLENAKKLQELGVRVRSYFVHELASTKSGSRVLLRGSDSITYEPTLPAYTVAELGEMLPNRIVGKMDKTDYWLEIEKCSGYWDSSYTSENSGSSMVLKEGWSMAECMSLMLIWLIENKHVDVKDLKATKEME